MIRPRILILARDWNLMTTLHEIVSPEALALTACHTLAEAEGRLETSAARLVLADWENGCFRDFQLLKTLRRRGVPSILLAPSPTFKDIQKAFREGVRDVFTLPPNADRLRAAIRHCLAAGASRPVCAPAESRALIGSTPEMVRVYTQIARIAGLSTTVLLQGESGTGKEIVARAIHAHSRRPGLFVAVHCSALPEPLLETELFGNVKGAFTGAMAQRVGWFEAASQGTCFLDEIADMPPALQMKLLRLLEYGEFQRVGSPETVQADVRIIAASNQPLETLVQAGTFRGDLYYRLNGIRLDLPPLRRRAGDIPALLAHFAGYASREFGKPIALDENLADALMRYSWPGNIRELAHAVERAAALSPTGLLSTDDFPEINPPRPKARLTLADFRRAYAREITERSHRNLALAARILGISRRSLYRLLSPAGQKKAGSAFSAPRG